MPQPRPYRQHEDIAQPFSGPLQQRLAEEWVRLHRERSSVILLERWSTAQSCLAGLRRPGDVVDAVDAAESSGKDAVLAALVELFQDGHQLAGRIVLQAMLPKLAHYAFRTGLTRGLERAAEDRLHLVLCEFWQVLGVFPVRRRRTRVAANLALETLHRITRLSRHPELPLDPQALGELAAEATGRTEDRHEDPTSRLVLDSLVRPDPDGDLESLLAWGVHRGVIGERDATLLREVYGPERSADPGVVPARRGMRDGDPGGYRRPAVGAGVAPATLRQRSRRARLRLAAAVAAQVEQDTASAG